MFTTSSQIDQTKVSSIALATDCDNLDDNIDDHDDNDLKCWNGPQIRSNIKIQNNTART